MLKIGCKDSYNVLHINNEIGQYVIGGAGTYMNEMYRYRDSNEGFVHITSDGADIDTEYYPGREDIFVMSEEETYKLNQIDCGIIVIQFYEFADIITEDLLKNRKLVYVIHSVPTPEPMPYWDAFGGNDDVRNKFGKLCRMADVLVCVSDAERKKLISIYPECEDKIRVIYNGITYDDNRIVFNRNYRNSRKKYGFIGRTDYRKGLIECIQTFKDMDAELHIACPKNDTEYVRRILEYIDAADMRDKVIFHGWCTGERKKNFYKMTDALIIPSLYEPFGYVALEAMTEGTPVISSNNGGLDEILAGYFYKYNPYADNELEETIERFMKDDVKFIDEQMDILIGNLKMFTAKRMTDEYHRLWRELSEDSI